MASGRGIVVCCSGIAAVDEALRHPDATPHLDGGLQSAAHRRGAPGRPCPPCPIARDVAPIPEMSRAAHFPPVRHRLQAAGWPIALRARPSGEQQEVHRQPSLPARRQAPRGPRLLQPALREGRWQEDGAEI